MGNDRAAEADRIAAAYWASVTRLGEKAGVSDSVVTEQAEAEARRTLATEQTQEAERAGSADSDETKRRAKAALRPRLRPRL